MKDVKIHVLIEIHAQAMLIVEYHSIDLFVTVHQDGEVIHKFNASNVSFNI